MIKKINSCQRKRESIYARNVVSPTIFSIASRGGGG